MTYKDLHNLTPGYLSDLIACTSKTLGFLAVPQTSQSCLSLGVLYLLPVMLFTLIFTLLVLLPPLQWFCSSFTYQTGPL